MQAARCLLLANAVSIVDRDVRINDILYYTGGTNDDDDAECGDGQSESLYGKRSSSERPADTNIRRQGIRMDSEHPSSQPQMNFLASANATAGPKPPLREVQARF